MLRVQEFHGTHEIVFTGLPSMVDVKKGFALGDHRIVMPCRAACGKSSPPVRASGNGAGKLSRADSCPLVETSREVCAPMLRPLRCQADPSGMIRTCEIKEIVVLGEAQFVFGFAAKGEQPGLRLGARGVQIERVLIFYSCFDCFA